MEMHLTGPHERNVLTELMSNRKMEIQDLLDRNEKIWNSPPARKRRMRRYISPYYPFKRSRKSLRNLVSQKFIHESGTSHQLRQMLHDIDKMFQHINTMSSRYQITLSEKELTLLTQDLSYIRQTIERIRLLQL